MSDGGEARYEQGQWASVLVQFIEDRNGRALIRLPNGSKTSVDYEALRPEQVHQSIRPPSAQRSSHDHIPSQLRGVLDRIYANGFVIDDDPIVEARRNTYALAFGSEVARTISLEQVTDFLLVARAVLAEGVKTIEQTPLWFYSWADEMAGQLRFSVSSSPDLPFGSDIRIVSDPSVVAGQFLESKYLDGIPWSEFGEGDGNEPETTEAREPFDVFVTELVSSQ